MQCQLNVSNNMIGDIYNIRHCNSNVSASANLQIKKSFHLPDWILTQIQGAAKYRSILCSTLSNDRLSEGGLERPIEKPKHCHYL